MAKVKSNLISKSQNVITLVNTPMVHRTIVWLQTQHYTNEELLEILTITHNNISIWDLRNFYQRLILSQCGPFNVEVFNAYTPIVFCIDTWIHLIKYSSGISVASKTSWVQYVFGIASQWYYRPFFLNGEAEQFGVDIYRQPYNSIVALTLVPQISITAMLSSPSPISSILWCTLDSMSTSKKMEWYNATISTYDDDIIAAILTTYPNTPSEMLAIGYQAISGVEFKMQIAAHKNCPLDIKLDLYDNYYDITYLPPYLTNLFVF